MNIMELGALGELVGSVGVVVTLFYLAIQIRQNTEQQKRVEMESRVSAFHITVEFCMKMAYPLFLTR
jgi:hypothetical protein